MFAAAFISFYFTHADGLKNSMPRRVTIWKTFIFLYLL